MGGRSSSSARRGGGARDRRPGWIALERGRTETAALRRRVPSPPHAPPSRGMFTRGQVSRSGISGARFRSNWLGSEQAKTRTKCCFRTQERLAPGPCSHKGISILGDKPDLVSTSANGPILVRSTRRETPPHSPAEPRTLEGVHSVKLNPNRACMQILSGGVGAGQVELRLLDMTNRVEKALVERAQAPGGRRAAWDLIRCKRVRA